MIFASKYAVSPLFSRAVAALVLTTVGGTLAWAGDEFNLTVKHQNVLVPIGIREIIAANGKSNLNYGATFNFHPEDKEKGSTQKTVQNFGQANEVLAVGDPNPTLKYAGKEDHGTNGQVQFQFLLDRVAKQGKQALEIRSSVKPTFTFVGDNPKEKKAVSIDATANDPFSFSDTNPDAMFKGLPDGIAYGLSIGAGTSFANNYTLDGEGPGVVASDTSMLLRSRAELGVFTDGDTFWTGDGGIDLYSLQLVPDGATLAITANLTFETPSSDFTLTYYDRFGNVFDPMNAAAVDSLESYIEGSFVNGVLGSDLEDLLTVTIVPTAGADFTVGQQTQATITAIEPNTPGPAAVAPFIVGIANALRRRKRSRAN